MNFRRFFTTQNRMAAILACLGLLAVFFRAAEGQAAVAPTENSFRVGERLTYNVSFDKFSNVAYAELYTVSRGKIGDLDAVELRAKFKTLNFVSAAFYLLDESRTVFAAPDSGNPIYLSKTTNVTGLPKEIIQNNLSSPASGLDLVTLIYRIRQSGGSGVASLFENEKVYNVAFQTSNSERVKTDAGEFETNLINVQSEYFTENGLKDVRVNISTDEAKIPVLIRFKTSKGEFRLSVASVQNAEPQTETQPTPTPIKPVKPTPTPFPTPTPRSYIDNEPLGSDLPFELGETLDYSLTSNGRPVGRATLQARERRQFRLMDSLLLVATATASEPGNPLFNANDVVRAQVDPETLGPQEITLNLTGALSRFNQTAIFDPKTSAITFRGTGKVDAPVGTHSLLSFLYAIRSFNLKPSKDPFNPINDTRVAVFWDTRPYIFTLRPADADLITIQGEKMSAQLITVTASPQIDGFNLKIWLSNDERRLPLRISIGGFQADLVSEKVVTPRSTFP